MALPKFDIPRASVDVAGVAIEVRGLSRKEMHSLRDADDDLALAEATALACGADIPVEEAVEWLANTPSDLASLVLDKILELSGLNAGK